jgi:tetratricopeptide (TPR) repeat protein
MRTAWVLMILGCSIAKAEDRPLEVVQQECQRLYQEARYQEAEKICRQALVQAEGFGPADSRVASTLNWLGTVYRALGALSDAEMAYRRAAEIWRQKPASEALYLATALNNLGDVYRERGRFVEAEDTFRQGLKIESSLDSGTMRSMRHVTMKSSSRLRHFQRRTSA